MPRTIAKEPVIDMQVRMDTTTIHIPFVLTTALSNGDPDYPDFEQNYAGAFNIRYWFDGIEGFTVPEIFPVKVDYDLYEVQISLATLLQYPPGDVNSDPISFSNYIYIQLVENGDTYQFYEKYFIVRLVPVTSGGGSSSLSAADISSIASSVWNFGNSSGTSLVTRTLEVTPSTLTASDVWNFGNSSGTPLVTRTLAIAPSTLTASDVWNFGNSSGTTLTTRTLETAPSTLTASDVWNFGNSSGTTLTGRSLSQATITATIDNHAIAHAVWTYGGSAGDVSRSLTTNSICYADGSPNTSSLCLAGECAGVLDIMLPGVGSIVWGYTGTRSLNTPVYGTDTVNNEIVNLSLATKADVDGISVSGGGGSSSISSSDVSAIAAGVWGYTFTQNNSPVNVIYYIAHTVSDSVWEAPSRELTSGSSSSSTSIDLPAIAGAVWNYGNNSGNSIATRTLSTSPSSLTAADVWGYTTRTLTASGGTSSVEVDADAIAEAVWEYNGTRELTTDVSVDFDTDDIAEAVWSSIKDNGELTALGEGLVADIATTVWTNTDRSLTTATLDDGELTPDVLFTTSATASLEVSLSSAGLTAVTAGVWDAQVRSLTTNVIGNNSANYLAIKADITDLQSHGDATWSTPNDYATTSDISDLQDHGDAEWAIPDDYATTDDFEGLSTFDASSDTVILSVQQQQDLAAYIVDGLATPSDIPVSDITAIKNKVDTLTNANLSTVTSAISAATSTLGGLITALDKPVALTTSSVNAIKEGLATATNVSDAKSDILDSISTLSSSVSDISTVVETLPSASAIATEVWDSDNTEVFAKELLSTDVLSLPVETNGFTLTHMILASQNSTVEQAPNTTDDHTAVWKIRGLDSNEEPVIIATRTLMLNNYGAIVGTSTPIESTETSEEPEETP